MRVSSANVGFSAFAFTQDGFCEWLTHNSGAEFDADGNGTAQIAQFIWPVGSPVSKFFTQRTPFALQSSINTPSSYREFPTRTGGLLRNYYANFVKADAEAALQGQPVGAEVIMPLGGGDYHFPNGDSELFKSISGNSWVPLSTSFIGQRDQYG
jgi:hypothetical protein